MRKRAGTRRRRALAGLMLASVLVTSCANSGGSKSSKGSSRPAACNFVTKLDQIADMVAHAEVTDPDTFNRTLDTAVTLYVANVRQLISVAPANLRAGLARVEADVQQLRFDDASTDRRALDAYATTACGRAALPVATPKSLGSTTSVPASSGSTTTAPLESTATTSPTGA